MICMGEGLSMKSKYLDLNNFEHQMIIAAMTNLAENGMHPREIIELLDEIKNQTFHALLEVYRGEA